MPQLRQNIITGEWVVIAPERSKRPDDFATTETLKIEKKEECIFCVGKEVYRQSIKNYETDEIYVVPNKYPAFVEDHVKCSPRSFKVEDDFYTAKPALGGHDVVVVKDHDKDIYQFTKKIWQEMFAVFKRRYNFWRDDCAAEYSMAIYNQGQRGAASVFHPHAQLFASTIVPNQVIKELNGSEDYFNDNGVCVFCDLLRHELKEEARVVFENQKFLAFTFYAARFPYEIWLLPKVHQSHFESEGGATFEALSEAMMAVLGKLNLTLKAPPFNLYIHDSPPSVGETGYYHWHLEITPRLSNYGGYELGSGVIIDVQSPEEAAEYLRKGR